MSEQKTVSSILKNLHPVQSVTDPGRTRTSLQYGTPAEHLTLEQMLAERPNIEVEKVPKEDEQQKRLAEKGEKSARKSIRKVENK